MGPVAPMTGIGTSRKKCAKQMKSDLRGEADATETWRDYRI